MESPSSGSRRCPRALLEPWYRYVPSKPTVPVLSLIINIENDADFKYASGNDEPGRGFGHICVTVDDLQAACARFDEMGVKFKKRPEEGRMRVSGRQPSLRWCLMADSF